MTKVIEAQINEPERIIIKEQNSDGITTEKDAAWAVIIFRTHDKSTVSPQAADLDVITTEEWEARVQEA